jgi:hypothetical protein
MKNLREGARSGQPLLSKQRGRSKTRPYLDLPWPASEIQPSADVLFLVQRGHFPQGLDDAWHHF